MALRVYPEHVTWSEESHVSGEEYVCRGQTGDRWTNVASPLWSDAVPATAILFDWHWPAADVAERDEVWPTWNFEPPDQVRDDGRDWTGGKLPRKPATDTWIEGMHALYFPPLDRWTNVRPRVSGRWSRITIGYKWLEDDRIPALEPPRWWTRAWRRICSWF